MKIFGTNISPSFQYGMVLQYEVHEPVGRKLNLHGQPSPANPEAQVCGGDALCTDRTDLDDFGDDLDRAWRA